MAASKVKITIPFVAVQRHTGMTGRRDWQFEGKITQVGTGKTTTLGDPATKFEARAAQRITLDWSAEIEPALSDTKLKVSLKGKDTTGSSAVDLGEIEVTLNLPLAFARSLFMTSSKNRFGARVAVDVSDASAGFSGPVTTILQNADASTHNTIHEEMTARMVHIHPVIPVPWALGLPPVAKGVEAMNATDQVELGIDGDASDLNAMVNPCVVPVLDPLDADFAKRCARIRITQMRPKDLDTSKLIWKSTNAALQLWDGAAKSEIKGGTEVKAYGHLTDDADQEATIEVRWDEPGKPLLATFRCWVGKTKYVWTRATVVKCKQATIAGIPVKNPTATPDQVKKLLEFNNIILWQAGILLALDTDPTAYNGAVRKDEGIFELESNNNYTFNVSDDAAMAAPMLNSRGGVFNITIIHSVTGSPNLLGEATDRRLSPAADGTATSSGSPSTSWVRPSGVFPDDPGQQITMKTMGASSARDSSQTPLCGDGAIDKLCSVIITEEGSNTEGDVTMAHELCHVLGLHHRGNGGNETYSSYDGVNQLAGPRKGRGHPWIENLMTYGDNTRAQDIDILQAQVIRAHPLIKKNPPPAVPPQPKPIPTAYLPKKQDIILLQEYLTGKRDGLTNSGYDLGAYGPDSDGVDGILGAKTKQGIRDFQRDHGGLTVDGIYGPKTRAAFDQELNG